ncbi:restriction endonuclease subunit S [Akkermansia sp.]|uniref:restriction endonuclease subunit S n=1 Tax=Akkermansia sp. TaxID=1872421 RepID=UPI003AB200F1
MNMDYAKLGTYCKVISGYAFKSSDWQDEGIPVIKIGNISNGCDVILDEQTQYVNDVFFEKLDPKYRIEKGDILVSLTGSHINQPNSMVGRSCRNYTDRLYLLNQRAGKVIPFASVDKDYLYYLFSTKAIKYDIANRAYGGANQVNVSPTDIKSIKWTFPEIGIQKKIAAVLSKYDELIHINNKRIKLLEKMAEKLYEEWFVHFRFPGHENYSLKEQFPRGWVVASKATEMVCPEGWHYGKFSEIGTFVRGKNITAAEMVEGDIPVISAGLEPSGYHNANNVTGKSLTISASGANAGYLKYHLSDIWAADCSYCQDDKKLWFIYNALKFLQPVISNMQVGAAQPHVYPKNINRLCTIIPDDDTIQAYCDKVEPIYEQIKLLKDKNANLTKQRDMLLPRLMSGKLEV